MTVTGGSVSFVYAGSESYTGGTTVSGGSLGVGASTWLAGHGPHAVRVEPGHAAELGYAVAGCAGRFARYRAELEEQFALVVGSGSYAGSISGNAATLTKTGSGTLTLGGSNFYTGPTTLNAGI